MKTIWKYPLRTTDAQAINMPAGAELLTIQVQNGEPCVWALVDPKAPGHFVTLSIYGTGHPVDTHGEYVGTYQLGDGALVFHVFREPDQTA